MYFFCLKIFFPLTKSVDPDEMQHYAAFHQVFTFCKSYVLVVKFMCEIMSMYTKMSRGDFVRGGGGFRIPVQHPFGALTQNFRLIWYRKFRGQQPAGPA